MNVLIIRENITEVKNAIKALDKKKIGKYVVSDDADYVYTFEDFVVHGYVIRLSDDTRGKIFKLRNYYDHVDAVDFGNKFYSHFIFVRSVERADCVPIGKVKIKKVLSKKLQAKALWK